VKVHCTIKFILFIISQHGALNFFRPLWSEWLQKKKPFEFKVIIDEKLEEKTLGLDKYFLGNTEDLANLPIPKLIVSSATGSNLEKKYFNFASKKRIKIFQLIDSSYHFKNRLKKTNGSLRLPNKIIVLDNVAIEIGKSEIPQAKDLFIEFGNPDWGKAKKLKNANLGDILFINQPIKEDLSNSLGYDQNYVIHKLRELKNFKKIKTLNICRHPRESQYENDFFDNCYSQKEGLLKCGTIIGMFSSLMVKAYYSGRNVISFQPNKIKNMDFLSQRNLIKLVKNVDELKKNIFDGCIVIPRTNPFKDSVKRLGNYLEKELIQ